MLGPKPDLAPGGSDTDVEKTNRNKASLYLVNTHIQRSPKSQGAAVKKFLLVLLFSLVKGISIAKFHVG